MILPSYIHMLYVEGVWQTPKDNYKIALPIMIK